MKILRKKKPITVVSVRKKRTGGWLQQDGLRDLIGESFKAQRRNMYFYHYMIFALLNVCFCHQRPHYVTIHNTEPHEGNFWEGKKNKDTRDGNKNEWSFEKKIKCFRFFISENRGTSDTVSLFVSPSALILSVWCEHQGSANVCCFKGEYSLDVKFVFGQMRRSCTCSLCFNRSSLTDGILIHPFRASYVSFLLYVFRYIRYVTKLIWIDINS